jgi:hypothetical protein
MGTALQLVSGYTLVTIGFGAAGILFSFLLNVLFITGPSFIVVRESFQNRDMFDHSLILSPFSATGSILYMD